MFRKPNFILNKNFGRLVVPFITLLALTACGGGGGGGGAGGNGNETTLTPGSSTITRQVVLDVGHEVCTQGGAEIFYGIDENGNGTLDPEEEDGSAVICHGQNGADGTNGAAGADGANGSKGADGQSGVSTVVRVSVEPAGTNCTYGGGKFELGLDIGGGADGIAGDGILQTGEVNNSLTTYVCDPNTAPTAGVQVYSLPAATTTYNVDIIAADANGETLSYTTSNATGGTVALKTGGAPNQFTFTFTGTTAGSAGFDYTVNDGSGTSNATALGKVVFNRENSQPVVTNQNLIVRAGATYSVDVDLIAVDPDGQTLSYNVANPIGGGVVHRSARTTCVCGLPNQFTFDIDSTFIGQASFDFSVNDGTGAPNSSATGRVVINVINEVPVAYPANVETGVNTPVDFQVTYLDPDAAVQAPTISVVTGPTPAQGTLVKPDTAQPTLFRFTPATGVTGDFVFEYKVTDKFLTSSASTGKIYMKVRNQQPVVTNQTLTKSLGSGLVNIPLAATDPDGHSLSYVISNITGGTVALDTQGGACGGVNPPCPPNVFNYTISATTVGQYGFDFTVDDGSGAPNATSTGRVVVFLSNAVPLVNPVSAETMVNTAVSFKGSFSDPDQTQVHTYSVSTAPNPTTEGTLTVSGDTFTFTPVTGFTGMLNLSYKVSDGYAFSSNTIQIKVFNNPPVAFSVNNVTNKDVATTFALNATDLDGHALSYAFSKTDGTALTPAANVITLVEGTLNVSALPQVTFTPNTGYKGMVAFQYKASDGTSAGNQLSNAATVQVSVLSSNNPPYLTNVGTPDQSAVIGDTVNVDMAPFFADPDGDILTYSVSTTTPSRVIATMTGSVLTMDVIHTDGTYFPTVAIVKAQDPDGAAAVISVKLAPRFPAYYNAATPVTQNMDGKWWTNWVQNSGTDIFSSNGTECGSYFDGLAAADRLTGQRLCFHAGEMRAFLVPVPDVAATTCATADLSIADALGAFDWVCRDTGPGGVAAPSGNLWAVSSGLKSDKGLRDLIDFTTQEWKPNSITATSATYTAYTHTSPSGVWWPNSIAVNNSGMDYGYGTNGTVYLITQDVQKEYLINVDNIALVTAPGKRIMALQTTTNARNYVVRLSPSRFSWIETDIFGSIKSGNFYDYGVTILDSGFNVVRNMTIHAAGRGINVQNTGQAYGGNLIQNVTLNNVVETSIFLTNSLANTISHVRSANWSHADAWASRGISATASPFTVVMDYNQSLAQIGVLSLTSADSVMSNVLVAGGFNTGVYATHDAVLQNITAVNNTEVGIRIIGDPTSTTVSASSLLLVNNGHETTNGKGGLQAIAVTGLTSTVNLHDILATNNSTGILGDTNGTINMTGVIRVGGNSVQYSGGASFIGNINTDWAYFTDGNGGTAFVGKPTVDATFSAAHAAYLGTPFTYDGTAVVFPNLSPDNYEFNLMAFDRFHRTFGKEVYDATPLPLAFPNSGHEGGVAIGGDGIIWDWSLPATGSQARGVRSALPNGDKTITHTWTPTTSADCAKIPGAVWDATNTICTTTYLKYAVEIVGDRLGNENGLCESNEVCLHTPNIGAYQGHGALVSAGAFTDSAGTGLTGITLLKYQTNGY